MRGPQGWEWIIILVIVLLLFGSKKLPDLARGLGRSMRILKDEAGTKTTDDPTPAQRSAPSALPGATHPTAPSPTAPSPTAQNPTGPAVPSTEPAAAEPTAAEPTSADQPRPGATGSA